MFKFQQVLRTPKRLKAETNQEISPDTRVVVMKTLEDGRVRVKVMDPAYPDLKKIRAIAAEDAFEIQHRGRPIGSGKKETEAVADAGAQPAE